jgi:hypothetical protein
MGYLSILQTGIGSVSDIIQGLAKVKNLKNEKSGVKNLLLVELELNISLLVNDYLENGLEEKSTIEALQLNAIQTAFDKDFDFTKLKKGQIKPELLPKDEYYIKFQLDNAERLFRKIHIKIKELKRSLELYDALSEKKLRLNVRLKNLLKLLLITAKFVSSK